MSPLTEEEVLQKIHKLPSLPLLVMELLASIDREDTDVDALAERLCKDQALTAKTLRLANSSFYGMARQVTTMQQSISILGFRTIRSLATTAALMGALPQPESPSFDLSSFWKHCIAVAVCARELAPRLQVDPEHAYTAGLLHDIGRLVLVTQFPIQFDAALAYSAEHTCPLLEAEVAVLGLDHPAVGHALTRHWKFPLPLQQAVAVHHATPQPDEVPLARAVRAADALVHALEGAMDEDAELPPPVVQMGASLGFESSAWEQTVAKIRLDCIGANLALSL